MALAHLVERAADTGKRKTDVEVIHKAIRFALENGEFYDPKKDLQKVAALVRAADAKESSPHGLKIRGYRSAIDGSLQPYGIEVPEGLDLKKPAPVWIWLHGRGDSKTDLHFLHERLGKDGQFRPGDAIVLHPFGRQCIGWKHAGEIDVFEALTDLASQYKIDPQRIALCGFSMGGAGAWHIGAHYTDRFAVVHAGAGFAETARYTKLKEADYPPDYEQLLWGQYDVPGYARNLLNVPLLAYSGENDKQMQAALVMEEALAAQGHALKHVIGPGMGHKYHPDSKMQIEAWIGAALKKGRDLTPREVHFQTRTLRYNRMGWVEVTGLRQHWRDSRVDASVEDGSVTVTTKNVTSLRLSPGKPIGVVRIDGQMLQGLKGNAVSLKLHDGKWAVGSPQVPGQRKSPGLQGPIDDAFMSPFLLVLPDKKSASTLHQRWLEFEIAHFQKRWKELFRGELRTKRDSQLSAEDHASYNIVAWGTPDSSEVVRAAMARAPEHEPAHQVVAMIRPNPDNPQRYLLINSGPTFREAHDRTNSLQNPKLGDWAVIDLRTDPNVAAPGEIVASGFFDEEWR